MANIGSLTAELGVDTRGLARAERAFRSATSNMSNALGRVKVAAFAVTAAIAALGAAATYAFVKLSGEFLDVAITTENLQLRLNALLGSVEEGAKAFEDMATFAGKVPFEYKDIMETATALAGIMKGGRQEINKWMPVLTDLAAASGLTLRETTSNFIKMYSAGAAAADMFRERGILSMLGFKAGVHYTAEETRKMLMKAWEDPASKFKGLTKDLATTWTGTMSMLSDAWFQFRDRVMKAGIFDTVKEKLQGVLDYINKLKTEGRLDDYAEMISNAFNAVVDALDTTLGAFVKHLAGEKRLDDLIVKVGTTFLDVFAEVIRYGGAIPPLFAEMGTQTARLGALAAELAQNFLSAYQAYKIFTDPKTSFKVFTQGIEATFPNITELKEKLEGASWSLQEIARQGEANSGKWYDFEQTAKRSADNLKEASQRIRDEYEERKAVHDLMKQLEDEQAKHTKATAETAEEAGKTAQKMEYIFDGEKKVLDVATQTKGTFTKMKDEVEDTPEALEDAIEQLDKMKEKYDALETQIKRMNAEIRQGGIGGAVSHTGGTTLQYSVSEAKGGILPSFTKGGFLQHFQGGGIMSGYSSRDKYLAAFRGGEAFISPERVQQYGRDTIKSIIDGTFQKPTERIVVDFRTNDGSFPIVAEKSDTLNSFLAELRKQELMGGM